MVGTEKVTYARTNSQALYTYRCVVTPLPVLVLGGALLFRETLELVRMGKVSTMGEMVLMVAMMTAWLV